MDDITELSALTIRRISVSEMDNNVYLLTARGSGDQVLIDAADDAPAITDLLARGSADAENAATLRMVVTTHSHWDHVRALEAIVTSTGAAAAAGAQDAADLPVPVDHPLRHGQVLQLDGFCLEVISLRGHTPGSVALLARDSGGPAHVFTGDSLFPGGLGNTQQDPARFAQLLHDVTERVFDVLPDDTVVHPGHGNGTTLGAERGDLSQWAARGW